MNWTNITIWAFVVLFWGSLVADLRTAIHIVAITLFLIALMKLDLWLSKKFDTEEK